MENIISRGTQAKSPQIKENNFFEDVRDLLNDGLSLEKDISGEIISLTLASGVTTVVAHGLRVIPKYRLILRQTGNGVITDVDDKWTDKQIGLLNNGATTVTLVIKLIP